jgi:hypothetical protein
MTLRLSQIALADGGRAVAAAAGDAAHARVVNGPTTIRELALLAIERGLGLQALVKELESGETVDLNQALAEGRVLAPVEHPDPAHMLVTGTGLTHLGSAQGRDQMHRALADDTQLTDSMRMFKIGLEGGKPQAGSPGAQPEWFYKGDGSVVAAPEAPLVSPAFALDAGEEPEIVGIYVIGPDGTPFRVGYALGNELSDHVTEKINYLYLAHSKIRPCSLGPEILVGDLPADVRGTSRIRRDGQVAWEGPFVSGEDHMCHSIRNLEEHHFKYALFRRPGDVHAHFFGTATLSFSEGFTTRPDDVFEIEADAFNLPLRNPLVTAPTDVAPVRGL